MKTPIAREWLEAPEVRIPEPPAIFCDTGSLWLAYEVDEGLHAVIKFSGVIEHWLSPINDEGLGTHPYARTGIRPYGFYEIDNSPEAQPWAILLARHWVITFKDNTLDVVARKVEIAANQIQAKDAACALLSVLGGADALSDARQQLGRYEGRIRREH